MGSRKPLSKNSSKKGASTEVLNKLFEGLFDRPVDSNQQEKVPILPRTKLLQSLRNNTLNNEEAVADLLDNPFDFDVNASHVWMYKSPERFVIADDGSGMTKGVLIDAMRLGSQGTNTPLATDLGFNGIGLKNASMSLGRRLEVITKSEDDEFYTAIYDLDDIIESGEFSIPINVSSQKNIEAFKLLTHNSVTGTVLVIEKLDNIQKGNDSEFNTSIIKHISETHRIFLQNGKQIFYNAVLITPRSPFDVPYSDTESPEIIDQVYDFKRPNDSLFQVRIKLGFLPPTTKQEAKRYNVNQSNQGFYVMRNDRQLMRGEWFDVAVRHNDFNRLRGEIYFTGDLDDVFKINFEKNKIKLHQWFTDQLKDKVGGIVYGYKQRVSNERRKSGLNDEQAKEDFSRIKGEIESKANFLPPLQQEGRKVEFIARENNGKEKTGTNAPHADTAYAKPVDDVKKKRNLVEFTTDRLELSLICYFEDIGNGALRIRWNIDHPFYNYVVEQNLETKSVFTKLLFALGRSIIALSKKTEDYQLSMKHLQKEIGDELRKMME